MLVVLDGLPEESWEYRKAISSLNFHINQTERASIMRIVEMLSEYHTSKEEERRVKILTKKVDREDVRVLMVDFMKTTYDLISRNSRAQLTLIMLAAKILRFFHREPARSTKEAVLNPSHALNAIRSHSHALEIAHPA